MSTAVASTLTPAPAPDQTVVEFRDQPTLEAFEKEHPGTTYEDGSRYDPNQLRFRADWESQTGSDRTHPLQHGGSYCTLGAFNLPIRTVVIAAPPTLGGEVLFCEAYQGNPSRDLYVWISPGENPQVFVKAWNSDGGGWNVRTDWTKERAMSTWGVAPTQPPMRIEDVPGQSGLPAWTPGPGIGTVFATYELAAEFEKTHRGSKYTNRYDYPITFHASFETPGRRWPVTINGERCDHGSIQWPITVTEVGHDPAPERFLAYPADGTRMTDRAEIDALPPGSVISTATFLWTKAAPERRRGSGTWHNGAGAREGDSLYGIATIYDYTTAGTGVVLVSVPEEARKAATPPPPEGAISKTAMAELMRELAIKHDWCSQHHDVMKSLDVEPLSAERPFEVTFTIKGVVTRDARMGEFMRQRSGPLKSVQESATTQRRIIEAGPKDAMVKAIEEWVVDNYDRGSGVKSSEVTMTVVST